MGGIVFAVFASLLGASLIKAIHDWKADPPKAGGSIDYDGGSGDVSYHGDGHGGHGDCGGGHDGGGFGDCGGGGHH
jgi:hypothetical protein